MPTDVVMPQMGESITEGTLTKWLKKPGDTVQRDEPLFEISTDKVDAEIPSPIAGTLGEIKVQEGATVGVNTVVATINEDGAQPAAPANSGAVPTKEDTVTPSALDTAIRDEEAEAEALAPASGNGAGATAGPGTEVLMPQMGESITEGTITKWLKKVGDTVQRDEPIFEISTDKVDAEIPSPIGRHAHRDQGPRRLDSHHQHGRRRHRRRRFCTCSKGRSSGSRACEGTRSRFCTCSSRLRSFRRRAPALLAARPQDRLREQRRSRDRSRHGRLRPHHQAGHHLAHQRWRCNRPARRSSRTRKARGARGSYLRADARRARSHVEDARHHCQAHG